MAPPSLPQPLDRLPGEPPSWDADHSDPSWDDGRVHGRAPAPAYPRIPEHPGRSKVFSLPATPASVRQARENGREVLDAWGAAPELCDDAVLVISELVTNAFTHTRSDRVVCRLSLGGGRLRVEVEDQSRGGTLPEQRQPDSDDQNGRGLMLVCALSSDWGADASTHGSGSVVWAELAWRPAEPAPGAVGSRPMTKGATAPPDGSAPPLTAGVSVPAAVTVPAPRRPGNTSSHVTRPVPRSAEGHLPHGTPALP
ncbi:ATP-binding protein [Streptomyces bluensis]|uniref:ATP-binding protein n=1 Tax=Streptomyces bluensis TaxID=33897 RepID=UPI00331BD515